MSKIGDLNNETKSRVELAINLDKARSSEMILLNGWDYRPDSSLTIADAMKIFIDNKYPALKHKIRCQRFSRDTVGDAIFSRLALNRILHDESRRVDIVTSDYHVARVVEIFNYVFNGDYIVAVHGAASDVDPIKIAKSEADSLASFRTTFANAEIGDLASMLSILSERHPYYNGHVFPKISPKSYLEDLNYHS